MEEGTSCGGGEDRTGVVERVGDGGGGGEQGRRGWGGAALDHRQLARGWRASSCCPSRARLGRGRCIGEDGGGSGAGSGGVVGFL
jgi:hypothetical protein